MLLPYTPADQIAKQYEKVEIYEQRMVQQRKRMQVAAATNQSTAEDCKIKDAVNNSMRFLLNVVEKQEEEDSFKFFARNTNDLRMELTELRKKLKQAEKEVEEAKSEAEKARKGEQASKEAEKEMKVKALLLGFTMLVQQYYEYKVKQFCHKYTYRIMGSAKFLKKSA